MVDYQWQPFDPENIPECSGVYGFYLQKLEKWLYIGQSQNIKKRFLSKCHPFHLACSLSQSVEFYFIERVEKRGRLEHYLHETLEPLGNGGVDTFRSHDAWVHPMHWSITDGISCSPRYSACLFVNEADRNAAADGISTHSFRRSFATNLAKAGRSEAEIAWLLGHKTGSVTARYIG